MRPSRIVAALSFGVLGLGLLSSAARGQDSAASKVAGEYKSRQELDTYYDKQFSDLDKRRMADLAALAAKQEPDEAEATYRDLFTLAVTRDIYDPASKAADTYLASSKTTPQTAALAHFVQIIAEVNREDYDKASSRLDTFLKSQRKAGGSDAKTDPNLIFAVGEAFLQRLIAAGKYDAAQKVATLFEDSPEAAVKEHFSARASRLARLGKAAPAFSATDVDGKSVSLADYKGKVVLVDFWATWCPPCADAAPHLSALSTRYADKGFAVLGVNVDAAHQRADRDRAKGLANVRRFLLNYRVPYTNVINGTGEADLAKAFGVSDIPANFLIGKDGKVIRVETFGADLDKAVAEALGEKTADGGSASSNKAR